jgi:heme oxygenase
MDAKAPAAELAKLDALKAKLDAGRAAYDPDAEARRHAEHMARLDRMREDLHRNLDTTLPQVRQWMDKETFPTWMHAAYADVAQRLERVEHSLGDMAESLRMILGQLAALERPEREGPGRD